MFQIPFSQSYLEFSLPPAMTGTLVTSRPMEPLNDFSRAVADT
ncbi:MAG: hypothetical protein HQK55_12625, partial [Deltaproteobacteria bacterium]|nr:hypothetical protein [Deltaproteobacteria bacterium]